MTDSRYCGACETDGALRDVDDRLRECVLCGHQDVTEQEDEALPPEWGWWAGSNDEIYAVGPLPTKEEAITEALGQGAFVEVGTPGGWQRKVFWVEAAGTVYHCDECGTVKEACAECQDTLMPDEAASLFERSRNEGDGLFPYDD